MDWENVLHSLNAKFYFIIQNLKGRSHCMNGWTTLSFRGKMGCPWPSRFKSVDFRDSRCSSENVTRESVGSRRRNPFRDFGFELPKNLIAESTGSHSVKITPLFRHTVLLPRHHRGTSVELRPFPLKSKNRFPVDSLNGSRTELGVSSTLFLRDYNGKERKATGIYFRTGTFALRAVLPC